MSFKLLTVPVVYKSYNPGLIFGGFQIEFDSNFFIGIANPKMGGEVSERKIATLKNLSRPPKSHSGALMRK